MNSYSLKKGFSWKHVLFLLVVILVLIFSAAPPILSARKAGDRAKALDNAKSLARGLISFKDNLGDYPCERTRQILIGRGIDFLPHGTSANAYLAQLVANENIDSEGTFFAPGVVTAERGDSIKGSAEVLLDAGENSFAYIMAADEKPLTNTSSSTPLVLAPIKEKGTSEPIFNKEPYGNKFVAGLADGSATAGKLDKNGHALCPRGGKLFQTGPTSLFGKDTPVVKYPLFRKR